MINVVKIFRDLDKFYCYAYIMHQSNFNVHSLVFIDESFNHSELRSNSMVWQNHRFIL